jgi:hypothetical protein
MNEDNNLGSLFTHLRGVSRVGDKFTARIRLDNRQWSVGRFDTAAEAAQQYDCALLYFRKQMRRWSRPNFPELTDLLRDFPMEMTTNCADLNGQIWPTGNAPDFGLEPRDRGAPGARPRITQKLDAAASELAAVKTELAAVKAQLAELDKAIRGLLHSMAPPQPPKSARIMLPLKRPTVRKVV